MHVIKLRERKGKKILHTPSGWPELLEAIRELEMEF